ncbi:hypothetical protein LOAG_00712 [Loa loa]|uniref:Uncharacterized protein n=1 Tax=Loa loa TaxID=7209 RepID=A0A1S0UAK5_LOALO|nr:hypothetical protein LOAG_00712 [Loa loa]EFO27763.2 hypothetical protein LOAG_00712 [Loa loa]
MGIAMMMQQAAALAKVPPGMDILTLEAEIRKAKAEGRTVTIANGCIYFDYQLIENTPYTLVNFDFRYGVGMGIAMMMQQAAALAKVPPGMDILTLEAEIRKAKAEGRTVTIANGCIYFDYQLIGCIPPDTTFHA